MRVAGAGILKPLCPMVMADVATFVRMVRSKTEDMIENMRIAGRAQAQPRDHYNGRELLSG
jgi:hypothetical protein